MERFLNEIDYFHFMVELIVKKYVPFVGVYESKGIDKRNRLVVPSSIVETLQGRQLEKDKGIIQLYCMIKAGENLFRNQSDEIRFLEFTDYFPRGMDVHDFCGYERVDISGNSRFNLGEKRRKNFGVDKEAHLVFIGRGDNFVVVEKEKAKVHLNDLI